jgi:hypothetical protein
MRRLETISGIVCNLRGTKGYEDLVLTASANGLAGANTGAELDMEYFTCTVNEVNLSGRFHKVEFADGEHIEFVVERNPQGAAVHAARSAEQRILWTLPYQTRGHTAQRRSDLKWSLILSVSAGVAIAISEHFISKPNPNEPAIYEILFYVGMFSIVLIVNFMIRRRFSVFALNATSVFQQLGYEEPENVDLHMGHSRAQKKMRGETGAPPDLMQPWSFRY